MSEHTATVLEKSPDMGCTCFCGLGGFEVGGCFLFRRSVLPDRGVLLCFGGGVVGEVAGVVKLHTRMCYLEYFQTDITTDKEPPRGMWPVIPVHRGNGRQHIDGWIPRE